MNSIRKIDKNIGIIPNWGDDDFDANVHENFTDLKEIIPAINNTVDDIDLAVNEMNILKNQGEAVTASASNSASVATQKAVEANISANQALASKNAIQGHVIPAGTSYSIDQINTQNSAMTKAQFNALAEEKKANRAGSGFDEMGWARSSWIPVNDGLGVSTNISNLIYFGDSPDLPSKAIGQVSRTPYPVAAINGTSHKLKYIGNVSYNYVLLPTAPNVYPYDTVLTAEQIANGVIKHADASNSGVIVNGKFDTDTSGWVKAPNYDSTAVINNGKLRVTATGPYGRYLQPIPTIVGKTYIVNGEATLISGSGGASINLTNSGGSDITINIKTFVATTSTSYISCALSSTGAIGEFDNIAVYPVDAISRSDLVFLESWHEDISEKNFVYPLGNVQYLGGNTDGLTGITDGAFTGFETYSLFGNWQTPSALIGKGYVWSSLTEAQKRAFIANPENNCYLDGDKTIQVRYRIRVLIGEDSNSMAKATVQGKAVVPSTVLFTSPVDAGLYSNTSATYTYAGTNTSAISIANVGRRNQGIYHNVFNQNGTKVASDGLDCFRTAVSFTSISDCFDPAKLLTASGYIGTVSGRQDGIFYDKIHEGDILDLRNSSKKVEDYNRLITREFNKLVAGTTRGFENEKRFNPITFTNCGFVQYGSGVGIYKILSTSSFMQKWHTYWGSGLYDTSVLFGGRYPPMPFAYIQASKSGIDYLIEVSPSNIGVDLLVFRVLNNSPVLPNVGVAVELLFDSVTWVWLPASYQSMGDLYRQKAAVVSTRTKSNTLLHCDIIGNPTNYPTAWKQNGVFGTPLIAAEDGTSLLPNGVLDSFKLSRKVNATPLLCLRSTDSGVTWTSFTPTFNSTTNEITLTNEPATNLVIVYYQTHTSMAVPVVNGEVLEIGEVLGTNGLANSHFISTLIGKVSIANTVPYLQRGYGVNAYRIDISTFKFSTTSTELPIHSALSLAGGASGVPAVKVLPYLTRLNGKAYLNLVFKEMKHNGTSWGDDSKFNIVDNVSTTTDNNAQTILIGQKTVELPYFIGADE